MLAVAVVVLLQPDQVVLVEVGQVALQPQMRPPELLTLVEVEVEVEVEVAMAATAAQAS
jgi:hypothetical protein